MLDKILARRAYKRATRRGLIDPIRSDFGCRSRCYRTLNLTPRDRRRRLSWILIPAVMWIALVTYRLVSLQVTDVTTWKQWALRQHLTQIDLAPERGAILDRNGELLAASVPAGSIFVRPQLFPSKDHRRKAAAEISKIIGMSFDAVLQKLSSSKPFVWVARQIPRNQAEAVKALGFQGADFMVESKRYYPYGKAAAALVGKVGLDGNGLSGLERSFDKQLRGQGVSERVSRDALGNVIEGEASDNFRLPKGAALQLTLDANIQLIVDEELEAGRKNAQALRAMGVLVDSRSGEVLALGQAPQTDFNATSSVDGKALRNYMLETVYEPGSTFKPIVAAVALEERVVAPNEMIDCEGGYLKFGRHRINDVHPHDVISFRDVIVRSSNIGMTKIGLRLGSNRLHSYLKRFGFGESSGLGLSGESAGIFRAVQEWAAVDVATHSYGQGIAVTPLQMVRAVSALANGGILPRLHVIKDTAWGEEQRVISEKTSERVREMMFAVTEDEHGTGNRAALDGVRVGGKTGTAQKARSGTRGYAPGLYVSSFVGFADGHALGVNRNLTLIVVIDEPHATSNYGGVLAAPVFRRIMQRSLSYLSTREALHNGKRVSKHAGVLEANAPLSEGHLLRASYSGK